MQNMHTEKGIDPYEPLDQQLMAQIRSPHYANWYAILIAGS
jgi:hypothetical protein